MPLSLSSRRDQLLLEELWAEFPTRYIILQGQRRVSRDKDIPG